MEETMGRLSMYVRAEESIYIVVGGQAIRILAENTCKLIVMADKNKVKLIREKDFINEDSDNGVCGVHRIKPSKKDR